MRQTFTFLFAFAAFTFVYGQTPASRESGTRGGSTPAQVKVTLPSPPVSEESHKESYHQFVRLGDSNFAAKDYALAIRCYKEALLHREEQYARDQILRAEAEMAHAQRETERNEALERYNLTHSVHFSGKMLEDKISMRSSEIYKDDPYSDIIRAGRYDTLSVILSKAGNEINTLDGLAVPPGMRLIIYSEPNLQGTILLDVTGPAVVNNGKWQDHRFHKTANTRPYSSRELQSVYPPAVRQWSATDMHGWVKNGSMEIIAVDEQ